MQTKKVTLTMCRDLCKEKLGSGVSGKKIKKAILESGARLISELSSQGRARFYSTVNALKPSKKLRKCFSSDGITSFKKAKRKNGDKK